LFRSEDKRIANAKYKHKETNQKQQQCATAK
jgi:hypothetical protein